MKNSAIIHQAVGYDVVIWLMTLGREKRLRSRLLEPARLQSGESVLDAGCGTGNLALLAQQQVGSGSVAGVDASSEMIARARQKSHRKGLPVRFEVASVESLPFPDASFDVVLCTVMLHHVPRAVRPAAVAEMRRVLKPGGRVLLADFVFGKRHSIASILHHHVGLKESDLSDLATGARLQVASRGPVGVWDLQYVVATSPR